LLAAEKRALLGAARDAVLKAIVGEDLPPTQRVRLVETSSGATGSRETGSPSGADRDREECVSAGAAGDLPLGAFVSIYVDDDLRGCVGRIVSHDPLRETVRVCAVAAATQDNRFDPLVPEEALRARFEISVLSEPASLTDPSEIEVGRHGLIVSQGGRKGLLLPQVASREGWDAKTFLDQTCRKAGLPAGAWRTGAGVEIFEACVFGETEPDGEVSPGGSVPETG
jgi:hypothetical protein